jgi:hypothetical protein
MSKQETLEEVKDLSYWKENAEEDYLQVPISVLRYISELEQRSYIEEEVRELLETQRGNCYVALLSHTKNDDTSSIALQAPEPGGKNGTWVKSI